MLLRTASIVLLVLFHRTVLFNDTIYYNIAYGRESVTRNEVIEAAKNAQIHDFIVLLPIDMRHVSASVD